MLLGTPLNRGPHSKQCMKSSPHHSFRHIHRGRFSDDDKFCIDLFLQAQASHSKPAGQREVWKSLRYICQALSALTLPRLQFCFFVVGSTFVGTNLSVGWIRQLKIFYLGMSSRFLFKRIWVTQGLPFIPYRVVLDKTPSINRKKFRMKSPNSFDFFEKEFSPGSEETMQEGARRLGSISRRNDW